MDNPAAGPHDHGPVQMGSWFLGLFWYSQKSFNYLQELTLLPYQAFKLHLCMAISRPRDTGWKSLLTSLHHNGTSMTLNGGAWITHH